MKANSENDISFENSFVWDGSSNLVKQNEKLSLSIKITPKNGIITPKGTFVVANLDSIVSKEDFSLLKCTLSGQPEDKTSNRPIVELASESSTNQVSGKIPNGGKASFNQIVIDITGANCTWTEGTYLSILFYDVTTGNEVEGKFMLQQPLENLEIEKFEADRYVVMDNNKKDQNAITFTWIIKNSGEYNQRLFLNGNELSGLITLKTSDAGVQKVKYIFSKNESYGDCVFMLSVNKDAISVGKSFTVRSLKPAYVHQHPKENIINLCPSSDGTLLFACVNNEADNSGPINAIEYCSDGFSKEWNKINLSPNDIERLEPFSYSPIIHLGNRSLGKLLFIGGSRIHSNKTSNDIAVLNLENDNETGVQDRLSLKRDLPFESRMGQTCAIFPHNGVDKIWLIGGQAANGDTLCDVWVSGDGENWENLSEDGKPNPDHSKPKAMPWASRCLLSSAVRLDGKNKSELWIGAGFKEFDGAVTPDIWRWDKKNWQRIANYKGTALELDAPYLWASLIFVGEDQDTSGLQFFSRKANDKKINSGDIMCQDNGFILQEYNEFSSGNLAFESDLSKYSNFQSNFVSFYFRGYAWFMSYTDLGDPGTRISSLYHYVPAFKKLPVNFQ